MNRDKKNVFLIGLNDFNRKKLLSIQDAGNYQFQGLLAEEDVIHQTYYDTSRLIDQASDVLENFPSRIDGLVGYMDFPVSTMVPVLCQKFNLPSASLESVLKCEHKYWSRLEQSRSVGEVIPKFTVFNPFAEKEVNGIDLSYPYWIKPIKSFGSHMGFFIDCYEVLLKAVSSIKRNIESLAKPFNFFLHKTSLPAEVAEIDGYYCLAEEIIPADHQCTLEGYVFEGQVNIHGVVDSIRYPGTSVFSHYQYPSLVPSKTSARMVEIARRFLPHIGYDQATFNMEFFWDREEDLISLLEVNTRIAQHHSDLFEKVDGISNHQIAVQIATGECPSLPYRRGPFSFAGVFFIRRFEDALVKRLPSAAEIQAAEEKIPGTVIQLEVEEGSQLSELYEQDSYSYILGMIYIGGQNPTELEKKYKQCLKLLTFEFINPED